MEPISTLDPVKCESCGSNVTPVIEDYIFEQCGFELVVKDCEIQRCPCGHEVAHFSPMEVQQDLAKYLIQQEEKFTIDQTKFLLEHILFRTEGFPHFNFFAKA
jgi:hypothetical protein